ncbi:MAG TPA: hypothetical protein VK913_01790, partial [Erythrobacter sp.]|nr:hypothetical protein [Erythrobacter sp.]
MIQQTISPLLALIRRLITHSESTPQPAIAVPPAVPSAVSARGVALIKQFEGCARLRVDGRVEAYPDPGTGGDP